NGETSRSPPTTTTGALHVSALPALFDITVELILGKTERNRVPLAELRPFDALAVDLHPVRRAEVDDPVRRALLPQLGVAPRHVRVRELDVTVARAADHDAPLVHLVARAVERERDELLLHPE